MTLEPLEQGVDTLERGSRALEQSDETLEQIVVTLEEPSGTLEQALEQNPETLEHTLEKRNAGEKGRVLTSETPSKEQLERLKEALGIQKGSMQYKKRGGGVYVVEYNSETKGYDLRHLGTWSDLQNLTFQSVLPQNPLNSTVLLPKER